MTKQSVVVPADEDTVVSANIGGVYDLPPKPVGGVTECILIKKKKMLMKKLETNGNNNNNVNVNVWLESMRASSPTHVHSIGLSMNLNEKHHQITDSNWIISPKYRLPSALSNFDEIVRSAAGKQIVMFLDYDGTLSPIVEDPDRAFMSNEMRQAVRDVARYFPTAIVSGRCRDKVYGFVKLGELYYAGSHGMDIKGPVKSPRFFRSLTKSLDKNKVNEGVDQFQPEAASEILPVIDEVYKKLVEKMQLVPGSKVENNKFCVSVHFRCVEEKRWGMVAEEVKNVVKDYPNKLKLTQGRKVLEIRPTIQWDKGRALLFLLEALGFANCDDVLPIYIGDDRTDEDAFKVLRERGEGIGILVSKIPKDTNASYSLKEPAEVMDFLHRLVHYWKKRHSL